MDTFVIILIVFAMVVGGAVGFIRHSEPKPYLGSIGISVGVAIALALLFFAVVGAVQDYDHHSELVHALGAAIGGAFIYSFGMILICPIPAIAGCLLAKFALNEKDLDA